METTKEIKDYTLYELLKLRKEYISGKLKLMGMKGNRYEYLKDGNEDPENFHVLGRIASALERYSNPTKIDVSKKEGQDKVEKMQEEIIDDSKFCDEQRDFLERIRYFYPDFGLHMREKVGKTDYTFYKKALVETSNLLKKLDGRALDAEEQNLEVQLRHNENPNESFNTYSDEQIEDEISSVIDSYRFNTACEIEDRFMMSEFAKFQELAHETGYDDPEVASTTPAVQVAMLVRQSEETSRKKEKYIKRYAEYQKYLNALTKKVHIVTKEDPSIAEINGTAPNVDDFGEGPEM